MRETVRLVEALRGARVAGQLPPAVDAIVSDSRAVRPGALFVALRGERVDGHLFVAEAVARGASVVVLETPVPLDVPQIVVADTRRAASSLADAFYDRPSHALTVIGVTGTNGKTTTTHLVRDVLEAAGIACGLVGTLGGELHDRRWPLANTTPLAVELHELLAAQRDAGARAVAMEVSSHALALDRVADVRFTVAALTNITRDHLDFHGTFDALRRRETASVRSRAESCAQRRRPERRVVRSPAWRGRRAVHHVRDRRAPQPSARPACSSTARARRSRSTASHVAVALPGRFNVRNALAAFGIGRALGIDDPTIVRGLAATRAVPGRMERIGAFGIDAIVDYAHTPDALENVLLAARETTKRELIVVFGCGGDRDAGKRSQMGRDRRAYSPTG